MRTRWLALPVMILAATSFVQGGGDKKEGKKGSLQGTWIAVKGDKKAEMTFAKGTCTLVMGGETYKGTYKTDKGKKPATIDITVDDGPKFKGMTSLGIYEVDGDVLKWCANEPGKEGRPAAFPDKEGDGKYLYLVFKRAKP